MKLEEVKAFFLLAGFEVQFYHKLENEYWPDHEHYYQVRKENPWWLVKTQFGYIKIGNRKRVTEVSWEDTDFQGVITQDDVAKDETYVHAWTTPKLLEYLIELRKRMNMQKTLPTTEEQNPNDLKE